MENKKFVGEMTTEELTRVFNANSKLQNEVLEDMIESELYWIGEKLDYIRAGLSDWSVGAAARPYIIPKKDANGLSTFLEGMLNMNKEIPAFGDEKAIEVIGNLEEKIDAYLNAAFEDDNYDEIEKEAEEAADEAANELAAQFERDLNYMYDHDTQLGYFLEFYSDSRMEEETYYIQADSETYQLYKDVSYTKTY